MGERKEVILLVDLDELEAKLDDLERLNRDIAGAEEELRELRNDVSGSESMLNEKREERNELGREIKAMLKDAAKQVAADKDRLIEIGAKLIVEGTKRE